MGRTKDDTKTAARRIKEFRLRLQHLALEMEAKETTDRDGNQGILSDVTVTQLENLVRDVVLFHRGRPDSHPN